MWSLRWTSGLVILNICLRWRRDLSKKQKITMRSLRWLARNRQTIRKKDKRTVCFMVSCVSWDDDIVWINEYDVIFDSLELFNVLILRLFYVYFSASCLWFLRSSYDSSFLLQFFFVLQNYTNSMGNKLILYIWRYCCLHTISFHDFS